MRSFIEKIHKRNVQRSLDKKQKVVDEIFKENGLTDEVIEMQLEINCLRNQEDVADSSEIIYGDYVQ